MKLVELTHTKGQTIWVNASQLLYVAVAGGDGGSLYGENNVATSTKLHFANGTTVEVKEPLMDVVTRLGA